MGTIAKSNSGNIEWDLDTTVVAKKGATVNPTFTVSNLSPVQKYYGFSMLFYTASDSAEVAGSWGQLQMMIDGSNQWFLALAPGASKGSLKWNVIVTASDPDLYILGVRLHDVPVGQGVQKDVAELQTLFASKLNGGGGFDLSGMFDMIMPMMMLQMVMQLMNSMKEMMGGFGEAGGEEQTTTTTESATKPRRRIVEEY